MTTSTITNSFRVALRSQFSEALELTQIAMDPDLQLRADDSFPPVLTHADFVAQFHTRSDATPIHQAAEEELSKRLRRSLLQGVAEDFFEIVPISEAGNVATDIGFRITTQGMRVAIEACRDRTDSLHALTNRVERKLDN